MCLGLEELTDDSLLNKLVEVLKSLIHLLEILNVKLVSLQVATDQIVSECSVVFLFILEVTAPFSRRQVQIASIRAPAYHGLNFEGVIEGVLP